MENAINLGVPVLGTLLGKSPLYYAQLKNDFVSINKLVKHLQSKKYYWPISLGDRDFLINNFQTPWKGMFTFAEPNYTKEAQDLIVKGF